MVVITLFVALAAGYLGYLLGLRRERGRLDRIAEIERSAAQEKYDRRMRKGGVVLRRVQLTSGASYRQR